jgi:hypothetical protein
MAEHPPEQSLDLTPAANQAIRALSEAVTAPAKLLISGGIGTGKTTALSAARDTLIRGGLTVLTRPPRPGDPPDAALVVDDAHLLTAEELLSLSERIADPRATVVVAAEPWENMRDLTVAIERDRPRVSLGPLPVADDLLDYTAGLPFLVHAVAVNGAQSPDRTARFALIDRLRRLDEATLDALLITSLAQELGTADVAAALGISVTDARRRNS